MRVVCDTNILARAYPENSGPSRRLLDLLDQEQHTLVLSAPILDELDRILAYPHIRKRWRTTPESIRDHRLALERIGELTIPAVGRPIVPSDPADDVVIYTAVAGRADIICTLDLHFLQPETLDYCRRRRVRVLTDTELLRELDPS